MIPPNPKCYVCSPKPEIVLKIDTKKMTVKSLRDEVLIKALNMVDPDVIIDGKGVIVISSEEGETESNDDILLENIQIVDGCILKVDDFFQNYELSITIVHKDAERDDAELFEVIADPELLKPGKDKDNTDAALKENGSTSSAGVAEKENGASSSTGVAEKENGASSSTASNQPMQTDDDDDSDCVIDDGEEVNTLKIPSINPTPPKKRKTSMDGPLKKRIKSSMEEDDDDDLILVD